MSDQDDDEGRRPGAVGPPEIASATLFGGGREIVIRHGGDLYRLRITKQNKLILNK